MITNIVYGAYAKYVETVREYFSGEDVLEGDSGLVSLMAGKMRGSNGSMSKAKKKFKYVAKGKNSNNKRKKKGKKKK